MIKHYIKISLRYLLKNKAFSAVNILGLTLGFSGFILLALFISDEFSFDHFHRDSDQIYRVVQNIFEADGTQRKVAQVAPLVGSEAKKQFPEVIDQTRLRKLGRSTVGNDPLNRDYEINWIADSNFFEFFDFDFLHGDPNTALVEPKSMVITKSTALKYFGETNVLHRTLHTKGYEATISGVVEDFPTNSHINMNTIQAESTGSQLIPHWKDVMTSDWTSNLFITYFKIQPGFNKPYFEKKLTALITNNYGNEVEFTSSFELQPLRDIHLYSGKISDYINFHKGNPLYIYMFSILGFMILLIACINYMNLSTTSIVRRTREIGMRKALGASQRQLILQFLGEAFILILVSLSFSLILIKLSLPFISTFVERELILPFDNIYIIGLLLLTALAAGIVSALYSSVFLSKTSPSQALKRDIKIGNGTFSIRKVLVIAQFTISIIMISATFIIYQQLNYMRNKELGVHVDDLLVVDINSQPLRNRFESIKQEFENSNSVQNVTVSSSVPGEWKNFPMANLNTTQNDQSVQAVFIGADEDFLNTYGIPLIEGRKLRDDVADSNSVLLSKSAVKQLGLDDPVGQIVEINGANWEGGPNWDARFTVTVQGIFEDFHFQSLREKRSPVILASWRNPISSIDYYTLKIRTDDWDKVLGNLQTIIRRFDSENPMEYTFLNTRYEQFYKADRMRGSLFLIFSGLIILISCMGLFALASFSMENRIQEIGIRKVLGAKISQIAWHLSAEFTSLVGIAFFISIPITWFIMRIWLREFAYRITIHWWVFPLVGLMVLIIALTTILHQTLKVSRTDPVQSLRNE